MNEEKKSKILIVDDDENVRKVISRLLKNYGYDFDLAKNGAEALEKIKVSLPDLIFLDLMMPRMDGYEVCKRLKKDLLTEHLPVIILTGSGDTESKIRCLEAGANDFLTKPIEHTELMVRTKNLLKVKEFADFLKDYSKLLESEVKERTAQLRKSYIDTIHRLTIVAEYKDQETANHIRRVGFYSALIAKHLGWDEEDVETISYASPMHDIGKISIPSEILFKTTELTAEEFALIKRHTIIGGKILHGSESKMLQMAERIALTHHEQWDGKGYPKKLRGKSIPTEGRIMKIVDQYDALRSKRPYKPPFEHEIVVKIITQGDKRTMPAHFDPTILKIFKDIHKQFKEIYEIYKD
ncbi:MAG TPA: two-component system response regulator [Elusimicrobia bacterium]|jgi:putative two-component system response regulator|nr:two-component system response regulator [Elusimicrobiota bacterium]